MSKDFIKFRYDGPILKDHSIDATDLASSLMALGDLCKLANKKFNGDHAIVKVMVNADLKQNCFELNLELVQTFFETTKDILFDHKTATAKEILEWIGIITSGGGAVGLGLFQFLKWIKNRKIESQKSTITDGKEMVTVKIEGDNNTVNITPQTLALAKDQNAVKSAQRIVEPLKKEGYDKIEFEHKNKVTERISKQDAEDILSIENNSLSDELKKEGYDKIELEHKNKVTERISKQDAEDTPSIENNSLFDEEKCLENSIITARIRAFSPVYKKNAKSWTFDYGGHNVLIDISETNIAENAIKRGGSLVNDTYTVELEITQKMTNAGTIKNRYKIKKVVHFEPANLTD